MFVNENDAEFVRRLIANPNDRKLIGLYVDLKIGCRTSDGVSWHEGWTGEDKSPAIIRIDHPGNWINPPTYTIVATFSDKKEMQTIVKMFGDFEKQYMPNIVSIINRRRLA